MKKKEIEKLAARYPISLRWDDSDKIFIACVHGLSFGGVCHGEKPEDVLKEAREIAVELVECFLEEGKPLPPFPQSLVGVMNTEEKDMTAREIREHLGLSQSQFANLLGVPLRTCINWENSPRQPTGAGKSLLKVAKKFPELLMKA